MEAKIQALFNQIESGKMKTDSAKILKYIIESGVCTTPDIEFKFGLKHQTASARITGLEKIGIIERVGTIETHSGTHTLYKHQPDPIKIAENAHEYRMKSFGKWLKRGRNFKELITQEAVQMLTA